MIRNYLILTPIVAALTFAPTASATPSSHIWTPSPDIQAHGTGHITADVYVPGESDASGEKPDTVTNLGITGGFWPIEDKLGVELGFDHITGYGQLDDYPLYFNAKVVTPENSLFDHSPALAFGGYYFGTESDKTDVNIYYLKAGETVTLGDFALGRFSGGWFWGNDDLLLDADGGSDDNGVLLTWERTISEISEKLGVGLDYQGTDSGVGALVPWAWWKFTDTVVFNAGWVIPNNDDLVEQFVVEVDIDFNVY